MSFQSGQIVGQAQDIEIKLSDSGVGTNERQDRVLAVIGSIAGEIAREFGGYLAVSVTGHVNQYEGIGDNLNIQLSSILPPPAPVRDTGLDAAGGSARNFPPEASTAAPATEDHSPPATQEPIPQSADAVPPTVSPSENSATPADAGVDSESSVESADTESVPSPEEKPSESEVSA